MKICAYLFAAVASGQQCSTTWRSTCQLANGAKGEVTLEQFDCNGDKHVQITGRLECVAAEGCDDGNHGFHIHQNSPLEDGENGSLDCGSAGSHFQVDGQIHGAPDDENRHYGALGNILLTDGVASLNVTDDKVSLEPGQESYIGGRGIVLHAGPDLFNGTSGFAGPRVSCCQITEAVAVSEDVSTMGIVEDESKEEDYVVISTYSSAFTTTASHTLLTLLALR